MKKLFTTGLSLLFVLFLSNQLTSQTWGDLDSRLVPLSKNLENGLISNYPATTTVVEGNLLYYTDYYGLNIYDVSNPSTPIKVSSLPLPGEAAHFVIAGNYAYICNEMGVEFVNISNPAQPVLEMIRFLDYRPLRIIVEQEKVYIASVDGVYAYTHDESHSLTFLGSIEIPPSTTLMGGFTKKDNYIYYVNSQNLYVVDATNPLMMYSVFNTELGGGGTSWGNLVVQDNYLYIATTLKLFIFNIVNPTNPTLVYFGLPSTHTIYEVLVEGNRMVVNHVNNKYFTIVDISDPANPVALYRHDGSWYHSLSKLGTLKNNILYAMDAGQEGYSGYTIHLIDITNSIDPTYKGSLQSLPGYTRSVSLFKKNNQAYALVGQDNGTPNAPSGILRILNVTHPDEPYQEGMLEIGSDIVSVAALSDNWAALISGTYVLPYYSLQLSLVNIENPAAPYISDNFAFGHHLGIWNNSSITTYNGTGFILSKGEMFIFKVSQGGISIIGNADVYGQHAMGVFTNNPNYVYIAGGNAGFQLYNVSNPSNAYMINYHQASGTCMDAYVENGVACVAAYEGGLAIYDVSQNLIVPLTQVTTIGRAISVVMLDKTAYVGMDDGRIQMFDIDNPAQPVSKGWYLTDGTRVNDMIIDLDPGKSHLYVANELSMPVYQLPYYVGSSEIYLSTAEATIYPNPAKDKVIIEINLPIQNKVEVKLYNHNGQWVSSGSKGVMPAGLSQIEQDVSNLPQGIYMVELIAGDIRITKKLIVN